MRARNRPRRASPLASARRSGRRERSPEFRATSRASGSRRSAAAGSPPRARSPRRCGRCGASRSASISCYGAAQFRVDRSPRGARSASPNVVGIAPNRPRSSSCTPSARSRLRCSSTAPAARCPGFRGLGERALAYDQGELAQPSDIDFGGHNADLRVFHNPKECNWSGPVAWKARGCGIDSKG